MNLSAKYESPEKAMLAVNSNINEVIKLCRKYFTTDFDDKFQSFYADRLIKAMQKYNSAYNLSTYICTCAKLYNKRLWFKNKKYSTNVSISDKNNNTCQNLLGKKGVVRDISPENNLIIQDELNRMHGQLREVIKGIYFDNETIVSMAKKLNIEPRSVYMWVEQWKKEKKKERMLEKSSVSRI